MMDIAETGSAGFISRRAEDGISTPRVGVYICHCGINIAATVDVAAVAEYAASLPGVVVARATPICALSRANR